MFMSSLRHHFGNRRVRLSVSGIGLVVGFTTFVVMASCQRRQSDDSRIAEAINKANRIESLLTFVIGHPIPVASQFGRSTLAPSIFHQQLQQQSLSFLVAGEAKEFYVWSGSHWATVLNKIANRWQLTSPEHAAIVNNVASKQFIDYADNLHTHRYPTSTHFSSVMSILHRYQQNLLSPALITALTKLSLPTLAPHLNRMEVILASDAQTQKLQQDLHLSNGAIATPFDRDMLRMRTSFKLVAPLEKLNIKYNEVDRISFAQHHGIDKLSPIEKYDVAFNNSFSTIDGRRFGAMPATSLHNMRFPATTAHLLKDVRPEQKAKSSFQSWFGLCDGWSSASATLKEPQKKVIQNGVTFFPADIKGLLAYAYTLARRSTKKFRGTMTYAGLEASWAGGKNRSRPWRYHRGRTRDINPASFITALVELVGKRGQSFFADIATSNIVSNLPVKRYRILHFKPITRSHAHHQINAIPAYYRGKKTKGYRPYSVPSNVDHLYEVAVEVDFLIESQVPKDYITTSSILTKSYHFVLEFSGSNLHGGEWIGPSIQDHPDDIAGARIGDVFFRNYHKRSFAAGLVQQLYRKSIR